MISFIASVREEEINNLLAGAYTGSTYWIDEDKYKTEDIEKLSKFQLSSGLKVMFEKYTKHFANFISGDYDEETSDVFLQCCWFGEVKFK